MPTAGSECGWFSHALLSDEGARGDAGDAFEGAGELRGVGEAQAGGGLLHLETFVREEIRGEGHPLAQEFLIGARGAVATEEPAGVSRGDPELVGSLRDRHEPFAGRGQELLEPLERREGDAVSRVGGLGELADFREQYAEELRAEGLAVRRVGETTLLEEVENRPDLARAADGGVTSRAQPRGAQEADRVAADEIDVVLPQPVPAVGADGVRDAGAVREHGAGGERDLGGGERELPPACGDEFDAAVRKIITGHDVVAANPFFAATHHGERSTVGRPDVEEVAAGRHDLPRHEGRQAPAAGWQGCTGGGHEGQE